MSIVVENLSFIYGKGTPFEKLALKNISFNIDSGEFVGIIGHTGSGKSTLIQQFNGLLKPTSGKVFVNGIDTLGKNLKELRKQVGIVFQYPEHQLFEETVFKDIAFGLQKQNIGQAEIEARVKKVSGWLGIEQDILIKSPFELSGGQKRRVAIAGVLVMEPSILILDEPSAGLDPAGRDEIFGLISRFHKELGITIIFVSHSMEDVAKLANRVIVLNGGSVEMDGTPSSVFKEIGKLEKIGLSAPQIAYLMKKLKEIKPEINDDIYTIEEAKIEIGKFLRRCCI
ncbi:MAG: energy-coupling factor transporter ATPase [Bacillota bacterium]|nr:energy-coupling factor transporter ATPase [Bacillota bacterium]